MPKTGKGRPETKQFFTLEQFASISTSSLSGEEQPQLRLLRRYAILYRCWKRSDHLFM